MAMFPSLPTDFRSVIPYLNSTTSRAHLFKAVQPFIDHESKLRQIFAQQPDHEAVQANHLVPVFASEPLRTKSRDLSTESPTEKDKYILSLPDSKRRENGSLATVSNLKEFKTNFSIFSEQSLTDLDWSNVVAAGSSVLTPLLQVADVHKKSKRALRAYYHEQLAPASDVDLFIYGLTEEQAVEKIKQIEKCFRDSVLSETTTIRTKNAITIVSEYPTRHVQIVLRLYKSITEVLTGFDVDCSCVAYDGKEVWASPRALAAFATQQNSIDLTRRSPSYESRLSKYSHRGFEVHWPALNRDRVDPTIYERAFNRVVGLARLLVLEKLPHPGDRDSYSNKRRLERGRPELPWHARYRHALPGNVKDAQPDDIPDWVEDDSHSDYHTFTIPYGPKFNARKIEKLLFKHDLLLNAEWNRPKDRKTKLHRHPAFFGFVENVIDDCCGFCPKPETDEDLKAHEEESKIYISGKLHFMKDDPGRQAIGSFNPLTADDWTDMAYLGSSVRLCQAIVDNDLEAVKDWFKEDGADVNRRDQTGRTPLQLACMCSSPEIVEVLIDHGARIVSRIYNGMTALHMAAYRGNIDIVKLLLDKSEANQKVEDAKEEERKRIRREAASKADDIDETSHEGSDDIEMIDASDDEDDEHVDKTTEGSFVKIEDPQSERENEDEPDVYDIDVVAWDSPVSALHLAIMEGHSDVVETLVDKYAADVMLPIKIKDKYDNVKVILNLVLPMQLPLRKASKMVRALLTHGATPVQADSDQVSTLHYLVMEGKTEIIDILNDVNGEATQKAINHIRVKTWPMQDNVESPLLTAIRRESSEMIRKLFELGCKPEIDFGTWFRGFSQGLTHVEEDLDKLMQMHKLSTDQPIIEAAKRYQLADVVTEMIEMGVDVNTITCKGHLLASGTETVYKEEALSLLDIVRDRINELDIKVGEGQPPVKPEPLPSYSKPVSSEGYQSWFLQTNYQQAKSIYDESMNKYEDDLKAHNKCGLAGETEKRQFVDQVRQKWQDLETKILERGAKTFKELHPAARGNSRHHYPPYRMGRSNANKDKPFENKVSFQFPILTSSTHGKYLELFEAVYTGDEDTVRALCLDAQDPLQVAVQDSAGYSPFSLAVVRGHYELARIILDIAAAQYKVPENKKETYRYSIRRPDDFGDEDFDDGGPDDANDVRIYRELVNETYTIDDIRTLSENTKSIVSPISLFSMSSELWRLLPLSEPEAKATFRPNTKNRQFYPSYEDEKAAWSWFNEMFSRERLRNSFSLIRYAIISNDEFMLKFLINLRQDLLYNKDDDDTLHLLQINAGGDFECALRLGRTEMLDIIIRGTGMLLPLASLAQKSGVQVEEKPDYYQGLSVYGQKRQDWAQEDQYQRVQQNEHSGSPLLTAILSGNVKTVEYFLSDTPLRCYEEFANAFSHDKHIKALASANGGIERALHSWMDTRTHLALHMAVMADPAISKPLRDFLIKRMPDFINSRSKEGISPLQLALQLKRYDAARELIAAGANQKTRNKAGENLLHTIYVSRDVPCDAGSLKEAVGLLDPAIIAPLTLQRLFADGRRARTPLMHFLHKNNLSNQNDMSILDAMMELSHEQDLEVMDGAGDYPLHSVLRDLNDDHHHHHSALVKYFAKRRPDLLSKENASGSTPLEILEVAALRKLMDSPPKVHSRHGTTKLVDIEASKFLNGEDPTTPSTTASSRKHYFRRLREDLERYSSSSSPTTSRGKRHRSLVSVLDANETARRLAEQQRKENEKLKRSEARGKSSRYSRRRYGEYDDEVEDEAEYEDNRHRSDEVAKWMYKAEYYSLGTGLG